MGFKYTLSFKDERPDEEIPEEVIEGRLLEIWPDHYIQWVKQKEMWVFECEEDSYPLPGRTAGDAAVARLTAHQEDPNATRHSSDPRSDRR